MIATKVTCDQCGREKGETNHWFAAMPDGGTLSFDVWEFSKKENTLQYSRHLCGRECCQKELEQWLERVSNQ